MIEAAVGLAEYHALGARDYGRVHPGAPTPTPPPVLSEFWRFRRYGIPPLAGGMRDQPVNWFEHAEALDRVYAAWHGWLSGDQGPEWRKAHADLMPTVKELRRMGYGR